MGQVLNFAERELLKYFRKMTGEAPQIALVSEGGDGDKDFDEHYTVSVRGGRGEIRGKNGRSVLLGVYHFLRELGCRFLYPTRDGEMIPERSAAQCNVELDFTPQYRHRGITIEGCSAPEHVLNLIDWAPKNGFNSYFIQFRTGYTFFERWYRNEWNPYWDALPFDDSEAEEINRRISAAMRERGMLSHAVGHGWTCEPLGIPSHGWDERSADCLDADQRALLAMLNGKRDFFRNVPLNTNLCYSNPRARRLMVDNIVSYAGAHPQTDVLHVWLGDNFNNFCECENCRKKTPSDWYVILLNELDAALSEAGLQTKIVFLIYYELLFPPKEERIGNPDRFILMFAPITRVYRASYGQDIERARSVRIGELQLNHFVPPVNLAENIAFLYAWQRVFSGDSFVFDYPLMWDQCKELGGILLAHTIYDDARALSKLGLNGYVSCQVQRNFFPTGFCMYVMGRALADAEVSFEELRQEYFGAAFGEAGERVYQMLSEISSWPIYAYMREELPVSCPELAARLPGIRDQLEAFAGEIISLLRQARSPIERRSFRHVQILLEYLCRLVDLIGEKCGKAPDAARMNVLLRDLQLWLFALEPGTQQVLDDTHHFVHVDAMVKRS